MKKETPEELKNRLDRVASQNKALIEEINMKNKTIELLLVAGHLDKDKLEQATILAGGI